MGRIYMDVEYYRIKVVNNCFIVEIIDDNGNKLSYDEAQLFYDRFCDEWNATQYDEE